MERQMPCKMPKCPSDKSDIDQDNVLEAMIAVSKIAAPIVEELIEHHQDTQKARVDFDRQRVLMNTTLNRPSPPRKG